MRRLNPDRTRTRGSSAGRRCRQVVSVAAGVVLGLGLAGAQPNPPPGAQDPLMSLMLSQPKIEIAAPVTATSVFDPPAVRPGQPAVYRVSFNALQDSVKWDGELPRTPLEFRPGGRGQVLQVTFTNYAPRTTFNFHTRPGKAGSYTVPEFTVSVYGKSVKVPAATLQVSPAAPATLPQMLYLELSPTNLYVGQTAQARIILPGSSEGLVQSLTQVQINGTGFVTDQFSARPKIEAVPVEGRRVLSYICDLTVTPITAGRIPVFVQGYAVGNRFGSGVIVYNPGSAAPVLPGYTLLDSDEVEVNVRPLPREGQLPGFTGGVGRFIMDTPVLSTNRLRVGDPVKLSVRVRGEGNTSRLVPPPPPRLKDWQVFPAPPDGSPAQVLQAQGSANFTYTLIPLTTDARATPSIPFSYFDVERAAHTDLAIPSVPVRIEESSRPGDLRTVQKANAIEAAEEEEKPLVMAGLAHSPGTAAASLLPVQQRNWFPVVQLAPAAAFLGLWAWDRRRRFYEQHPDRLLRRKARRRLHREWRAARKAALAKDAESFAARAIESMRVACAPHYPAEPRALVCGDILAQLSEVEQQGALGDVVRRFFTVTNANRYAIEHSSPEELLAREQELRAVLERLEARL